MTDEYKLKDDERDPGDTLISNDMNQWLIIAGKTPTPKKLFGDFFLEGETTFLFADSNVGKSLLAYQIAESIASGISIHEDIPVEVESQLVYYFDFELSIKQLEKRYAGYKFSENLVRFELSRDILISENIEDAIYNEIEKAVMGSGAKIIIIDNITYIRTKAEKSSDAIEFMRKLNQLRSKEGLSILVLTHTPKRNPREPITDNDMMGSKNLTNATDASFSIGRSEQGNSFRYLKQTKVRLGDSLYHSNNVINCEILQRDDKFTGFQLNGYSDEYTHLKKESKKDNRDEGIYQKHMLGESNKDLAKEFGVSEKTIQRSITRWKDNEIMPF